MTGKTSKKKSSTKKKKTSPSKPVEKKLSIDAELHSIIQQMNKDAGQKVVNVGLATYDYERIPFTSPMMNYCTFGGIPEGRITEFYGPEHGGKTSSLIDIMANYQNKHPDRDILLVDAENTFDANWAQQIGFDTSKLIIFQPEGQGAEEIFQFILDMVSTGKIGLWALDSLGALVTSKEIDNDIDEQTYAGISGPLTRFTKKIQMQMKKYNCTGIAINQERDNISNPYAGPITVGGRAWKYLCSVRLRFWAGKYLDDKGNEISKNADNPVAVKIMMSMTKNKTCAPTRRTGYYTLNFDEGIDYFKDLIEVAMKYSIIDKHGAWFDIIDVQNGDILQEKIQGQAKLYTILEEDRDLLKKVEQLVDHQIQ